MNVLEASGIHKSYGGVAALTPSDFAVAPGTVHALLGENGAGKSTVVKVLAGVVQPDGGTIRLDGRPVRFTSTADAARHGVAVVSQELNLFPHLDVLANLFTKRETLRGPFFNRRAMSADARPVLAELGLSVPLRAQVGSLTLAQRQLVEVAKALLTRPRVLILDEPTSALDHDGTQRLLGLLDVLRQREVAVVFVSHILEEVMQLSDVVTVLRDGRVVVPAAARSTVDIDSIVHAMLGDRLIAEIVEGDGGRVGGVSTREDPTLGSDSLWVNEISVRGLLNETSLTARVGEIVGLAGLAGAGHHALLEVISGVRPAARGTVRLPGQQRPGSPPRRMRRAVRRGIAPVSGDRRLGLMLDKTVWENVVQVSSVSLARDGFLLRRPSLRSRARSLVERLGIRTTGLDQLAGRLSGGNQQKAVLAKWLDASPTTLLLDDPTRGVDVGAKAELHELIRDASRSSAVLLCSTDLDEIVALCHRVLVFRRGRIAIELTGSTLTRHRLLTEMNAVN
jgi:ABC-type sugar transport system ATPase subunit